MSYSLSKLVEKSLMLGIASFDNVSKGHEANYNTFMLVKW